MLLGTVFWNHGVPQDAVALWEQAWEAGKRSAKEERTPQGLALPRKNPYICSDFSLHPFPAENDLHPLLGAALKVQRKSKPKQQWRSAFVIQYNSTEKSIQVAGDSFNEWYHLDGLEVKDIEMGQVFTLKRLEEGKAKTKLFKFRLVEGGTGGSQKFTVENIWDFNTKSLPICPAFLPKRSDRSNSSFQLWFLHDPIFLVPRSRLSLQFIFANGVTTRSAVDIVLLELMVATVVDALNEELYMAAMAELNVSMSRSLSGRLGLGLSGYNHKVICLFWTSGFLLLIFFVLVYLVADPFRKCAL